MRLQKVGILLQGNSLKKFDEEIEKYKGKDIIWASLNHFYIPENILKKIGENLQIVYMSSPVRIEQNIEEIHEYLKRMEDNIFITTSKYDNHCIFTGFPLMQNKVVIQDLGIGFNSMMALIVSLDKLGYREAYLFGADGGSGEKDVYYDQKKFKLDPNTTSFESRRRTVDMDTRVLNQVYPILHPYWNMHIKVYNTNPKSKLTCFPYKEMKV